MLIKRRNALLRFGSIFVLTLILTGLVACWGSPTFTLIVENQTIYDLTISINGFEIGKASPGKQITATRIPWDTGNYLIEAKNIEGTVVFSKTLIRAQMIEIKSRVYKIIMKP